MHNRECLTVCLSKDGRTILTGAFDNSLTKNPSTNIIISIIIKVVVIIIIKILLLLLLL